MAKAKRNPELPGTERAAHPILDEVFGPLLELRESHKASKTALEDAREAATARMITLDAQGGLEKDTEGRPCYVYRDGEQHVKLTLVTATKLSIRNMTSDADDVDAIG